MKKQKEAKRNQIVIHVPVTRELAEQLSKWAEQERRERTNLVALLLEKAVSAKQAEVAA
jgi:hypothetical protein